jgi:hypothetical protein
MDDPLPSVPESLAEAVRYYSMKSLSATLIEVVPTCAQCGARMMLDGIEPSAKSPGVVVQIFRCDACRLLERVICSSYFVGAPHK